MPDNSGYAVCRISLGHVWCTITERLGQFATRCDVASGRFNKNALHDTMIGSQCFDRPLSDGHRAIMEAHTGAGLEVLPWDNWIML